jgi:hypothetical protein
MNTSETTKNAMKLKGENAKVKKAKKKTSPMPIYLLTMFVQPALRTEK